MTWFERLILTAAIVAFLAVAGPVAAYNARLWRERRAERRRIAEWEDRFWSGL